MADKADRDAVLSREQLAEFQRNLSLLSDAGVEREYERCWREAWYNGKDAPPPIAFQQLVGAWRVLRKFQKK